MYKIILTILIGLYFEQSYSQLPDSIRTYFIVDTVRSYTDCVIKINVSRKDGKEFKFVDSYAFGNIYSEEELLIEIQKLDNSNKFNGFDCNEFTHGEPVIPLNQSYTYQRELGVTDSLGNLDCITRGYFRLRILFNDHSVVSFDGNSYKVKSNWVYFYVEPEKLYLGRIRKINGKR